MFDLGEERFGILVNPFRLCRVWVYCGNWNRSVVGENG